MQLLREFKLKYYFAKYKDYPVAAREYFIKHFLYKEGYYKDLKALVILIEQYQLRRYKQTLKGERTSR